MNLIEVMLRAAWTESVLTNAKILELRQAVQLTWRNLPEANALSSRQLARGSKFSGTIVQNLDAVRKTALLVKA